MDYKKTIRYLTKSSGLKSFDLQAKFDSNDYSLKDQYGKKKWKNGLVPTEFCSAQSICIHDKKSSIILVLDIENRTKEFLKCIEISGSSVDDPKPSLFYSETYGHLFKLGDPGTFSVPPHTRERLIFAKKRSFFRPKMSGVITFSLGNNIETHVEKVSEEPLIMMMFQIIGTSSGHSRNSFALGYPDAMLTKSETNHICSTQISENKFFKKGFMDRGWVRDVKMTWIQREKKCIDGNIKASYMFGGGCKSIALLKVEKKEKDEKEENEQTDL